MVISTCSCFLLFVLTQRIVEKGGERDGDDDDEVSGGPAPASMRSGWPVGAQSGALPEFAPGEWAADWPIRWLGAPPLSFYDDISESGDVLPSADPFLGVEGPVVLRQCAAVLQWPAMQEGPRRWTPEFVAQRWGESADAQNPLENVFRNDNRVFGPHWDGGRPLSQVPSVVRKNPNALLSNLTMAELVERIVAEGRPVSGSGEDSEQQLFWYFAGNVDVIGDAMQSDVQPLSVVEDPADPTHNTNFWLGQAGTIAETHYDGYENFMVQVYGRKRWLLLSPDSDAYVYPFSHPSHAQSQVFLGNFSGDGVFDRWPGLKTATAFEVTLEPGDVLFMPSCWYHRVEALDDSPSVCINGWTRSFQNEFMTVLSADGTPVERMARAEKWTTPQFVAASRIFIETLVARYEAHREAERSGSAPLPPDGTPPASGAEAEIQDEVSEVEASRAATYVEHLFEQRFQDLVRAGELLSFASFVDAGGPEVDPLRAGCTLSEASPRLFGSPQVAEELRATLRVEADRIIDLLMMVPERPRDLWLGNVIEYVAFDAVLRKPGHIAPFLDACFLES
jgi:Cupin-like domain